MITNINNMFNLMKEFNQSTTLVNSDKPRHQFLRDPIAFLLDCVNDYSNNDNNYKTVFDYIIAVLKIDCQLSEEFAEAFASIAVIQLETKPHWKD